jgi:hypothetical protein
MYGKNAKQNITVPQGSQVSVEVLRAYRQAGY